MSWKNRLATFLFLFILPLCIVFFGAFLALIDFMKEQKQKRDLYEDRKKVIKKITELTEK